MDGSLRGVPVSVEPIWLASKLVGETRKYRHQICLLDEQVAAGLSLTAAPSGSGELALSNPAYGEGIVSFLATGGQPSRSYTILLTVTRSDDAVSEYLLKLLVTPTLANDQAQAIPSVGFGIALTLPC